MSEDCYFFVDMEKDVPDEQRTISVLCVKCRNEHYPPGTGWFWPGSKDGYGPWDYKCSVCQWNVKLDRNKNHEEIKATS